MRWSIAGAQLERFDLLGIVEPEVNLPRVNLLLREGVDVRARTRSRSPRIALHRRVIAGEDFKKFNSAERRTTTSLRVF